MITRQILELINAKLRAIIFHLILIGLLFFILAAAILFYPEVLLYVFVISFFIVSFSAFLIAVKISHIKRTFDDVMLFSPKKKKVKK
jgi:voltage-gated potassium channel Kch